MDANDKGSTMTATEMQAARYEGMLRELASDLRDLVESGDLTEMQANEWLAMKADQWLGGDR